MFVRMTLLQHWKSEHDAASCEDAAGADLAQGLFAIADGAGTTLFANIWARVLVKYFLQVPLLSNDAFEVEWWIRQAQERYQQEIPLLPASSWSARQKMHNQGSHATLATLRVLAHDAQSLDIGFLAIGDSCLLIRKAGGRRLQTFPYTMPEQFDAAPICLPSLLTLFNRSFHQCLFQTNKLAHGDQAILATDAVARWILSAGKGSCSDACEAFQLISEQTPQNWPTFVEERRMLKEMVDDDSTALSLSFTAEALPDAQEPGIIHSHSPEVRASRKQAFERAQQEQNKELLAITYGDGTDLKLEGISLSPVERDQARQVANALHAVLSELRRTLNSSDMVPSMRRVWTQYAPLLDTEPCAANLRRTLTQSGVLPLPAATGRSSLAVPASQMPPSPLPLVSPETPPAQVSQDNLLTPQNQPEKPLLDAQQAIQASLASKSIEQMALAYTRLPQNTSFLMTDELKRLDLAYRFKSAYDASSDDELLEIWNEMLQAGQHVNFLLSGLENARLALIGHSKEPRLSKEPLVLPQLAKAETLSADWVHKVTLVKRCYLIYREQRMVPTEQAEQLALTDLNNQHTVESGIQNINKLSHKMAINPDREAIKDFKRFRDTQKQNFQKLIEKYELTEKEIKEIIAIFVRARLLEEYLQRTVQLSLRDWLTLQRIPFHQSEAEHLSRRQAEEGQGI